MKSKIILSLALIVLAVGCTKTNLNSGKPSSNNNDAQNQVNSTPDVSVLGQKTVAGLTQIASLQTSAIAPKDCFTLGGFGYSLESLVQRLDVNVVKAPSNFLESFNQQNINQGSDLSVLNLAGGDRNDICNPFVEQVGNAKINWRQNLVVAKTLLTRIQVASSGNYLQYNIELSPAYGNLKLFTLNESEFLTQFERDLSNLIANLAKNEPAQNSDEQKANFIFKYGYNLSQFQDDLATFASTTDSANAQQIEATLKSTIAGLKTKALAVKEDKDWAPFLTQLQIDLTAFKTQVDSLYTELDK